MDATRNDPALDELATEGWDRDAADLDLRDTSELVSLLRDADATVAHAVALAHDAIVDAVELVVARLAAGGRLVYVGAGTSGLLAHADAVDCRATFGLPDEQVVAIVAGGPVGGDEWRTAEDDAEAGIDAVRGLAVGPGDAVVGVSASGRTPFVLGALEEARRAGSVTVAVVCVEGSELGARADLEIAAPTGAEVLSGSTRLKAGSAQKLVLNTLSTVSMIRLGATFGNLMVGVVASNEKLRARVRRIVRQATGAPQEQVDDALAAAGGETKVAIVMLLAELDAPAARARLTAAGGVVRRALAP